jgi:hypothetical protein
MGIKISRDGSNYRATISPPDSEVCEWESPPAGSAEELVSLLVARGCHPVDVWDALAEFDPKLGTKEARARRERLRRE